ncbi:hypothetical protein [Ascidiimonas sp. W6]|uniref:hypothetical protein n=1 Tax=Ascidiimonas meishanensis TaxID=3128903 RepID=UPI0030EF82EF
MALIPSKLTLAPYLQRWDADTNTLYFNVLVMPTGNPLQPLGTSLPVADKGPAFANANLHFDVRISDQWQQLPDMTNFDFQQTLSPAMPLHRPAICNTLKSQFNITQQEEVMVRKKELMIRKHLMKTYTESFAFVSPKTTLAFTDDTYQCLLNCPPKNPPTPVLPDDSVSWAEAFSFVIRQPKLAQELGLVYTLEVPLPNAQLLKNGGWIFISLDAASDYHHLLGTPNFLKAYASRIPALNSNRPLFTPVLFPVANGVPLAGNFDDAFLEYATFNDGFAKIVHGGQAKNRNHLEEKEQPGFSPLREEGVQLGWDDEDLVVAQNRQMSVDPETLAQQVEAPMGVVGYRIDVREKNTTTWHSLNKVATDSLLYAGQNFGAVAWESRVEVAPAAIGEQFWLPSYFARWKGGSIVVTDADDLLLLNGQTRTTPLYYKSVDAQDVPLKYGTAYEFRVRMVDTTNGGPTVMDEAIVPGDAPISKINFKRFVPPGEVTWPETDFSPEDASVSLYNISRPRMGIPQALYTQVTNVRSDLLTQQQANIGKSGADLSEPTIFDPDTPTLSIRVLVRTPDFDPTAQEADEEGYMLWYQTTRDFPLNPKLPLPLQLSFVDTPRLSDLDIVAFSDPGSATLQLPTARDIKIELQALGTNDLNYFGSEQARRGTISDIKLHKIATAENDFILPQTPQDTLRSVYLQGSSLENDLQPTATVLQNESLPVLVQRLAGATGLVANDTTLLMPPGERGIFGCSKELNHYLPANNSSLVLMGVSELSNQWINMLHWKINRDWTWKGFANPVFEVTRRIQLNGNSFEVIEKVGSVRMMHAVTPLLDAELPAEKEHFSFVFMDAFQPPLGLNGLPYEVEVSYFLTVNFENGDQLQLEVDNLLPITTPPKQIPKVASAGIALSPYVTGEAYASTGKRGKMLWLEFEEAPVDARDNFFVRVLAQTADPMLLEHHQSLPEPHGFKQWALDPEWVRVISPGQSDDSAGLTTMQRLIPAADSDRHFLVPLPSGTYPDSPELFGFYTYEIRVGHDKGSEDNPFWSTAQGRFGAATVLQGVQHPCPTMSCSVHRVPHGVVVSSSYAKPYHQGRDIQATPPNTQIHYVLYARVHQADGSTMRNIELDKRAGHSIDRKKALLIQSEIGIQLEPDVSNSIDAQNRTNILQAPLQAHSIWSQDEISNLLTGMGLPEDTPLSVLGIELLPEPTGSFADPLGGNLGQVRILRTSPLYPIASMCC